MFKSLFLSLAVVVASVSSAKAVTTYNISGSFSGGQLGLVNLDIDITADFSIDHFNSTTGLVINTLTSTAFPGLDPFPTTGVASGPLQYDYYSGSDWLVLGGGSPLSMNGSATDFTLAIDDLSTATVGVVDLDTLDSLASYGFNVQSDITVTRVEPDVIPLPAGGLLLVTGLLTVAGIGYRKKRIS